MDKSKQVVEARIKYLEELAGVTPERKSFSVLARLAEAKEILRLLEIEFRLAIKGDRNGN